MTPAKRRELAEQILRSVDPRLVPDLLDQWQRAAPPDHGPPNDGQLIVLAGHRAAGKSALLPQVAELCERPAIDLDEGLARERGVPIRDWYKADPRSFRAAERALFSQVPSRTVIAVGGGFLSHHADVLTTPDGVPPVVILIPVTFSTYRDRLLSDTTRPCLRLDLTAEDEIAQTYAEREIAHARVPTVPLINFLHTLVGGAPGG